MSSTRPVALVTGASAGIGRELCDVLAREGHDLILVARREPELTALAAELKERYGADSRVVVADLSKARAAQTIVKELGPQTQVDVLVNNAGFGGHGKFWERNRDEDLRQIAVNVTALTELTRLLLPGMVERHRGRVLNVASTAAFQPGPFMAVYYATKAYVLSFSEAISSELAGTGVTVTEFQKVAGVEHVPLTTGPLSMSARSVAEAAYKGMAQGKRLVVPGVHNKVGAASVRLAPRGVILRVVRRLHPAD
ncbi:MAG TPA: SDR family oxidoreductase [Mycobacteriales bacterium]|nr:SDR family oxidoreductase [Mycobacteriales bacterium]